VADSLIGPGARIKVPAAFRSTTFVNVTVARGRERRNVHRSVVRLASRRLEDRSGANALFAESALARRSRSLSTEARSAKVEAAKAGYSCFSA
jgi:hypothetical protein